MYLNALKTAVTCLHMTTKPIEYGRRSRYFSCSPERMEVQGPFFGLNGEV
jgi:hypothetical protein